ncbi:MAG: sensor histidine kinase [Candidatus Nanopelagicales bacterium]
MGHVAKLLEQRTELSASAINYLVALTDQWGMVADLALSDLVMWVPTWNEAGLLAVAQVRPSTAPTNLAQDATGTFSPRGRNQQLDQAEALGRASIVRSALSPLLPAAVEAYPVSWDGDVIAVIARHASQSSRVLGQLEQVYLETADSLLAMVGANTGAQPWAVQDRDAFGSWDQPRVGDGLIRLDHRGVVDFASPNGVSAFRRLGLATNLVGQDFHTVVMKMSDSPAGVSQTLRAVSRGGRTGVADLFGTEATIMMTAIALNDQGLGPDSDSRRTVIVLKDVTGMRAHQKALLSKDATIKEINHRVKNNLQMVNSLLRLQARRATHDETREVLADAQARIAAIAAIHDVLSESSDSRVDIDHILDAVIDLAIEVSSGTAVVRLGSGGMLPAKIATPLAMSLSELVHNALEHSGADRVEVEILRINQALTAHVRDNGNGSSGEAGLGLSIVADLVTHEMRGIFALDPIQGEGTYARIEVPLPRGSV